METQNTPKKLIINKTVYESVGTKVEKEITLPFYSKKENCFYKVTGDGNYETLEVVTGVGSQIDNRHNFDIAIQAEEITEAEFKEAYLLALTAIAKTMSE